MGIIDEIKLLKRKLNAVILAHNYQTRDIQEVADFVGDSLALSLRSMSLDADIIVFAGVFFMAEQAKILNPDKKVLIPERGALCSLAYMAFEEDILRAKREYPDAPVVVYVNSPARIKAIADYVVTSANAVDVVSRLDSETIIFSPDANLASYVAEKTNKKIIPVPRNGHCYVHLLITPHDIELARSLHPDAVVMVHPEVPQETRKLADFVGGTGAMVKFVSKSNHKKFLVGTEIDMISRLSRDFPDKEFYPIVPQARCIGMKKITLKSILLSLKNLQYEVKVEESIASKAREALQRTFELMGIHNA